MTASQSWRELASAGNGPQGGPPNGFQLRAWWRSLAIRERRMVTAACILVVAAVVWWVALAPALTSLRNSQALHSQLDAQLQQMQALKAQALALQSQPIMPTDEARRALQAGIRQTLGNSAQAVFAGDRATVTLKGVPADALAQWLVQARVNARSLAVEAHLVKSASSNGAGTANPVAWDGTLVMTLPAK